MINLVNLQETKRNYIWENVTDCIGSLAFKNNKDFKILYEFIQHRLKNPDPRFAHKK